MIIEVKEKFFNSNRNKTLKHLWSDGNFFLVILKFKFHWKRVSSEAV